MKKLIIFLLVFISLPTFARSFDIEVIIFKRNIEPSRVNEAWPSNLEPINFERSFSYRNKDMMSSNGAYLLPSGYYKLNKQYQALNNHAGFKPLIHVAWRQTDRGQSRSPIFHIQAGQDFSSTFANDGRSLAQIKDESPDGTVPPALAKGPVDELDGTMQVYVQHYLYVQTNLNIKIPGQHEIILQDAVTDTTLNDNDDDEVQVGNLEPIKPKTEVKDFLNSYRMQQKRQMRSGETHYLDNPYLGMIIQVRKVK
ncbi:peptidoglycan binding protein CsiV [Vibrio hibernica]|uniref:peptidoglycan binding protein CsiV n=1 Tax=Vibrio hibernica TaxID=2587465 RepID=UPI001881363E|nr:peptidoglycan binding protein CsiV [Vibrio hibernica]